MPLSESFFWKREIRFSANISPFLAGKEGLSKRDAQFKPVIPPQGIVLDEVEKEYILEALRIKEGNKNQAAKLLGISRSALLYRMEKYGIK